MERRGVSTFHLSVWLKTWSGHRRGVCKLRLPWHVCNPNCLELLMNRSQTHMNLWEPDGGKPRFWTEQTNGKQP